MTILSPEQLAIQQEQDKKVKRMGRRLGPLKNPEFERMLAEGRAREEAKKNQLGDKYAEYQAELQRINSRPSPMDIGFNSANERSLQQRMADIKALNEKYGINSSGIPVQPTQNPVQRVIGPAQQLEDDRNRLMGGAPQIQPVTPPSNPENKAIAMFDQAREQAVPNPVQPQPNPVQPQPNPAPPAQQIKPPVQLGQPRPFKKKGIRQLMQPMIKGK